jgi:uncharacterized protein YlbG (UPF0298 family)
MRLVKLKCKDIDYHRGDSETFSVHEDFLVDDVWKKFKWAYYEYLETFEDTKKIREKLNVCKTKEKQKILNELHNFKYLKALKISHTKKLCKKEFNTWKALKKLQEEYE